MRAMRLLVAVVALVAASACAAPGNTGQPGSPATAPTLTPPLRQPSAVSSPSPSNAEAQPAIDAVLNDAAKQLNVSRNDLHVDQVEAREWPDKALGCPRQGQLYAQIVTPGYLIVVSGPGKQLEYHTDARGQAIAMCAER